MLLSLERLPPATKPALTLLLLSVLCLPTAGCFEATRTTVTAGSKPASLAARCAGWTRISYSGDSDTMETIEQVRIHNQVGRNKRCWK